MTAAPAPLYGGLLIGGTSSRMGQPKQLLTIAGLTLLERTVAAVRPLVERVVLIGTGAVPAACAALPRVPDAAGHQGPLAGMLAALTTYPTAAWLFVACDLARIDIAAVRWVIAQRAAGMLAILPRSPNGRIEPLLALYEPEARLPLETIARARQTASPTPQRGQKGAGPRLLAERPDVATPSIPADLAGCWTNVNTPDDWAQLAAANNPP